MMMEQGIWYKYDDKGNLKEGEVVDYHTFKNSVNQVIKELHGNYDPNSPLLIKQSFAGRAVSQFRTWMFESFNTRFGEATYDEMLESRTAAFDESTGKFINKKGRYRSLLKKEYMMVVPLLRDFKKAFTDGIENDVDAANLRKNAVELAFLFGLMAIVLALKGGDDEKKGMMRTFLINQINRFQTDILMYVHPTSFEELTKKSIPAMSLVTDGTELIHATMKALAGDDKIKSGEYAKDSRLAREVMQFFPILAQYPKTKSSITQEFDK